MGCTVIYLYTLQHLENNLLSIMNNSTLRSMIRRKPLTVDRNELWPILEEYWLKEHPLDSIGTLYRTCEA